ncbi:hypothetical protein STRIP9103_07238, partial [Streptomyces ipomoeae 91-03]
MTRRTTPTSDVAQ